MASLSNDNGLRRVQFFDRDGKRRTIRLGRMDKRQAEKVRTHVAHLVAAMLGNQPVEPYTSEWVDGLGDKLYGRLSEAGLVKPRSSALLAEFIDRYIERRGDVKPSTMTVYKRARRYLVDYFGRTSPSGRSPRETPMHGGSTC